MEFFNQLVLQLRSIFSKMTKSQRISFLLILASIAICLVLVFIWSSKPDYVVLFSDLSTDDAAKIHAKLTELKVPYTVTGTTIMVPSQYVYETRLQLANEGLPKGSFVGYEIFDKVSLGQTDYLQRLNFQRALEGELARTISSLDTVEFARVHLVIPKQTIFKEKEERVSASIIVTTRTGATLAKSNVLAITHLVASSVEGLVPNEITIIDSNGNLLSAIVEDNIAVSLTSSQLEVQRNIERYLENKVSSLLTGVLGPGKAIVRVNTEIDFSQQEETSEKYNPDGQVARSENRIEELTPMDDGKEATIEKTISNYEIDKTVKHIIGATGAIKRLSLAVVVDGTYRFEGAGNKKEKMYVARTDDEKESIHKLVVSTLGISDERGDTVEVINIPFDTSYLEEERMQVEKMQQAETLRSVLQQWPWLIVLLVFGGLFFSLQKIITQASIAKVSISGGKPAQGARADEMYEAMREEELAELERQSAEEQADRLLRERMEAEVVALAAQNPDAVAKVVKEWLQE